MRLPVVVAAVLMGCSLQAREIKPNDPAIGYSDFASSDVNAERARFDRFIEEPNGFRYDNPGARIRFRSDAKKVSAHFFYNNLHRREQWEGTGAWLVDGQLAGSFTQPPKRPAALDVEIVKAGDGREHEYEIVLPYGDSVDFTGLTLDDRAMVKAAGQRSKVRYVAYGDSITHGFSGSDITKSYPFLVGEKKRWEVINMGFGSREATAADGEIVAGLRPDVITFAMGFNDFYRSKSLAHYKQDLAGFVANVRKTLPDVPIYIITPLWSTEPLKGELGLHLEDYRKAIRELFPTDADPRVFVINGLELTTNGAESFTDGIHPNDRGFQEIADRLAEKISVPEK